MLILGTCCFMERAGFVIKMFDLDPCDDWVFRSQGRLLIRELFFCL